MEQPGTRGRTITHARTPLEAAQPNSQRRHQLIGAFGLRERLEDPDTDRMVTKLDELQGTGRAQILQEARTILAEGTTPAIQLAIAEIERLFGYYI